MKGGSLSQAIKDKKLSERQLIGFARDVVAGLSYLHIEKNIIHRDIKPQNILVLEFCCQFLIRRLTEISQLQR